MLQDLSLLLMRRHLPNRKRGYKQAMEGLAAEFSARRAGLPLTIWRETSLQHFDLPSGGCAAPRWALS